jgi:poly(A) polymerase
VSATAERLRGSAAVAVAAEAIDGPAWVVGGAVRDAALGRAVIDADIAVEPGAERDAARAIASAAGGAAFELSQEFGTWRALAPGEGWHVDVTPLRGESIEADLALRDFTVNALAVPLSDLAAEPIDVAGGRADLERRLLRAVSERAFADDPLRLLRAARIAAALGFEIEAGTLELARAEAPRAGEPAGERRLAELRLLVAGTDPIRAFELLDAVGATPGVLPELDALRGVEQNPNHHLDVHGHTIEVLRRLLEIEADLDTYAGSSADGVRELLATPLADGFTRGDSLRLGALMHDIGKPATKGEHSGYVTFIGHDAVGAELVAESLARLKASRALSRYVEGLARNHLHLGFMVHERPLPPRRLYRYLARCGDVAPDVTLLTAADRMSARGTGAVAAPEMIEAHLELVREVLPAALEWQRSGPPAVPIPGDELARELGIDEGPRLGELIEELRAAVFAGEVRGRDQAVEHARRALTASTSE